MDKQDRKREEIEPWLPMQLSPIVILPHQSFLLPTLQFSAFPPVEKKLYLLHKVGSIFANEVAQATVPWSSGKIQITTKCQGERASDHRQCNRILSLIILQPDEKYELRSKILPGTLSLGLQHQQHPRRSSSGLFLTASFQRVSHTRDTQAGKVEMCVKYQEV